MGASRRIEKMVGGRMGSSYSCDTPVVVVPLSPFDRRLVCPDEED